MARVRLVGALVLAVAVVATVAGAAGDRLVTASHQDDGLQNPGFEEGILGGAPVSWAVEAASDAAVVVGTEGPADFATYAETGTTVTPYDGSLALRLGTPKQIAQQQNRGSNTVAQSFHSTANSVEFALRAFSWEHRGHDTVSFTIVDPSSPGTNFPVSNPATGGAFALTMASGAVLTCSATPCSFSIDVGNQGQFLDSGWLEARISGLPSDGRLLTIRFNVTGGQNQAHATWAYFDAAEEPPVALFSFAPDPPLEGDFVQFTDESYDPAGGEIVEWEWEISGPEIGTRTFDIQNPVFSFPDNATYAVKLTVTNDAGKSDTVESGTTASDGTAVAPFVVENAAPRAKALNLEVLSGTTAPLFGRFIDPGWLDTHTATWVVDGDSIPGTVTQVNEPAFTSGIVTGEFEVDGPPRTLSGSLTVEDKDGGSVTHSFELHVLGPDFDRREPNDSVATAPPLPSGWRYISELSDPDDYDLFEIRFDNGGPLPPGGEVLVRLGDLPADYDLAVLAETPAGTGIYETSPWLSSPWFSSPWFSSPWFSSPWFSSPWLSSPWFSSPWFSSPWFSSPWLSSPWFSSPWLSSSLSFDQFPLSQLAFAQPDSADLSGGDIGLVELGLAPLAEENLQVIDHSANAGTTEEAVLVTVPEDGSRLFVAVTRYKGAYSSELFEFATGPYSLTIEASRPLDLAGFLEANCDGLLVVDPAMATHGVTVLHEHPGATMSLIVTQRERLMALYDLDEQGWDDLLNRLQELADHELIAADIISVPSAIYNDWDANPCSIDEANAVAEDVRDIVQERMLADANMQYLVFAGNDDIIPHKRIADETTIGNESLYTLDSMLLPGSPLFAAMLHGQILSDDYYLDADPAPWLGRELYVPDWDFGRLAETPEEIAAAADAFLDSDGQLAMSTALVTGYDFFTDGAHETADNLSTSLLTDRLISETWTADDLRCLFLGELLGEDDCTAEGLPGFVRDVIAPNAHYAHYGALSAHGFNFNLQDFISSEEIANAGAGSGLNRSLVFTIGCHAGLSVPDRAAVPPEAGLEFDPRLDIVQAMARQQALFVANTGHGLGDSDAVAGNEKLMAMFAQNIAAGGTAGTALRQAKVDYLLSLSALSVYEEKASVTTGLWGLPQYVAQPVAQPEAASASALGSTSSVEADAVELTLHDGDEVTNLTVPLSEVTTANGTYFETGGDTQVTPGRPIQPRVAVDLEPDAERGPVHGVVIRGGTYVDIDPFDPVIARPQQEWEVQVEEPSICVESFWPSVLASVNTLSSLHGLVQKGVIIPAQFLCTSGDDPTVTGTERLYDSLELEFRRSTSDDFTPPTIAPGGLQMVDQLDGTVDVIVDAQDASGIAEIVVYTIGGGVLESFSTGPLTEDGPYTLNVPLDEDARLVVQVVDGAGNVASFTGKGLLYSLGDFDQDGYPDDLEVALGKDPNVYCAIMRADVNMDGVVNMIDLSLVAAYAGQTIPPAPERYDQNADGVINILDMALVAGLLGDSIELCP